MDKRQDTSGLFKNSAVNRFQQIQMHYEYWLRITQQSNSALFVWTLIWNVVAFAFIGMEDGFQLWSSILT